MSWRTSVNIVSYVGINNLWQAVMGYSFDRPTAQQLEQMKALLEQAMQDGHCGALPAEMLPWFIDQQRFRDAMFARAALDAMDVTGGPIVVITGNGHARTDWGMPVYLAAATPDVAVLSVGQITAAQDDAPFDFWRVTEPIDRPDPCAAFK